MFSKKLFVEKQETLVDNKNVIITSLNKSIKKVI